MTDKKRAASDPRAQHRQQLVQPENISKGNHQSWAPKGNCWWVQTFARFPSLHMKYHEFLVPNNFHVFRGLQSMNLVQAKLGLHTFVTAPICWLWFVNHFSQLDTLIWHPELSFGLGGPVAYMICMGIQNHDLLQHQQHYRILQAQMQEWLGATSSTLLWTARETTQKQKVPSSFETTPQRNRGPRTPTWQCRWGKRYFTPVGFGYQIYPNLRPDEIHGQSMSKQHQSHPTHNL